MLINMTVPQQVEAKVLKMFLKVSDQFSAALHDANDKELKEYEGYVPDFFPGEHYGDYVILDIDIDTGRILNWKTPTPKQIEKFINEGQEEDD